MSHNPRPQSDEDELELATRLLDMWRDVPPASRQDYLAFLDAFEDPEQDPDQYRRIKELFLTLEYAVASAAQ